jgi:hypothetical protein
MKLKSSEFKALASETVIFSVIGPYSFLIFSINAIESMLPVIIISEFPLKSFLEINCLIYLI